MPTAAAPFVFYLNPLNYVLGTKIYEFSIYLRYYYAMDRFHQAQFAISVLIYLTVWMQSLDFLLLIPSFFFIRLTSKLFPERELSVSLPTVVSTLTNSWICLLNK
jgi:hypothetical protein